MNVNDAGSLPQPNSESGLPPLVLTQLPQLDHDINSSVITGMIALVEQTKELLDDNSNYRAEVERQQSVIEELKSKLEEKSAPATNFATPELHEPLFYLGRRVVLSNIGRIEGIRLQQSDDMRSCDDLALEATVIFMRGSMNVMENSKCNPYFTSVLEKQRVDSGPLEAWLKSLDLSKNHVETLLKFFGSLHLFGTESKTGTHVSGKSEEWTVKTFNPCLSTLRPVLMAAEDHFTPDHLFPVHGTRPNWAESCELPSTLVDWQTSLRNNVDDELYSISRSGMVGKGTEWTTFTDEAKRRGVEKYIGQNELLTILSGQSNPHLKTLVNIAKVLGLTMSQLLRRNDG